MVTFLRQLGDLASRLVRGWNDFWFMPADPVPLGLMRICCGLLLLYVHLTYGLRLQEWVGKDAWLDLESANELRRDVPLMPLPPGWKYFERAPLPGDTEQNKAIISYERKWGEDPRQVLARGIPRWSIWFHVTDPTAMMVVHAVIVMVMFLFTLGFCTRLTAVLSWLAALSYMHRGPTVLFGMDAVLSVALLYLMIGPGGAALSVDRLLARWRAARRALKAGHPGAVLPGPVPSVAANFALRLFQVHLCLIYLASGCAKLLGPDWWTGDAIWGTAANHEMSPMRFALYVEGLRWLAQHRWLLEVWQATGSLFTLAVEVGFPFLIWHPRMRWVMIPGAVLLHSGIGLFMDLSPFSFMMITLVLSFVPAEALHRLLRKIGRGRGRLQLRYDSRIPAQVRAASWVRAFDVWDQVALADVAREGKGKAKGLELAAADGTVWAGYSAYAQLARSLRILWPLGMLTWVPGLGVKK
jgi:hypothetical protein